MIYLKDLKHIFRAYDIRGDADTELVPEIGYLIGYGYAHLLVQQNKSTVTIAYDGRLSSPDLTQAVIQGLVAGGAVVTNIGLGPTPYLYFCDRYLKSDASIMITGSHNQGHINGLKFVLNHQPFWGDDIIMLYEALLNLAQPLSSYTKNVSLNNIVDLGQVYIDYLVTDYKQYYKFDRGLRIVWDPGNGAAGELINKLIIQIPGQHQIINGLVDGHFPNHHPDPSCPENLTQLITTVHETQSDIGIAFDGDADRIGIVTSQGSILYGEHLLELLVPEVLANNPGATIIADVKTSQNFISTVIELGGRPLLWKTGHSAIKAKMLETHSLFAAEMSGHIFFADRYFGYDDGLYTALRIIGLLNTNSINLDEWLQARPKFYSTPELRIYCKDKFDIINLIQKGLNHQSIKYNNIDGIRVDDAEGWWLIRASNTQELIVLRAESSQKIKLKGYINLIIELLMPYDIDIKDLIDCRNSFYD